MQYYHFCFRITVIIVQQVSKWTHNNSHRYHQQKKTDSESKYENMHTTWQSWHRTELMNTPPKTLSTYVCFDTLPYSANTDNYSQNKARIDCPWCCHLIWLCKVVLCVFARNGYSYMPFITKPRAACELCLSCVAMLSSLGLCAHITSSTKPEIRNISLRRQRRTEPWS